MLTILSSLAQEESRSISENVKWGIREGYRKGRVRMPYYSILGFGKVNGKIVIIEEEAKIVRLIYSL